MSPMNELIIKALEDVQQGRFKPFDDDSGYCQRIARQCVEHALGLKDNEFYDLFPKIFLVDRNGAPFVSYWARDIQLTLRTMGMKVDIPQGGDLAFFSNVMRPMGHVGVLLTPNVMFENTSTKRGIYMQDPDTHNRFSNREQWPNPYVEYFRLNPDQLVMP